MFYNAAMRFDRDLNVAVLRAYWPTTPPFRRGWEMLAATGARGLRLVEETDGFDRFDFTERNAAAYAVLERNLHDNGHSGLSPHLADATATLEERAFDYVDVDPFGTPVPYVPAALAALKPNGLLAVTATDMPVLTGVAGGVAEARYGARPVRGSQGPEAGLRILTAYLITAARGQSLDLTPVLGYVHDHYVRVYLSVRPADAASERRSPIGGPAELGEEGPEIRSTAPWGPLWLGPLFDPGLVTQLEVPRTAALPKELGRFLDRLREEVTADRPFYYEPNELASGLHLREPPSLDGLLQALRSRGFSAGRTHVRPSGFRTTAPRSVVHAIARGHSGDDQSQNARVRA